VWIFENKSIQGIVIILEVQFRNDMFKKYSVTELLKELSKIKMISLPELDDFVTECAKRQNENRKIKIRDLLWKIRAL
jgi:hypothetical protein